MVGQTENRALPSCGRQGRNLRMERGMNLAER